MKVLEDCYLKQKLSITQISKRLGYGRQAIYNHLIKNDIPIRSREEGQSIATKGKPRPWSRNSPNLFKVGSTPWTKGKTAKTYQKLKISGVKIRLAMEKRHPRVTKLCKICGKEFKVKQHRSKTAKYCSPECGFQASRGRKQWWVDKRIQSVIKGLKRRPTKPEMAFINIVERNNLPYQYNGNRGDLVVGGHVPDFYNINGKREVVEILGRAFHDPNNQSPFPKRPPEEIINHYTKHGFKCICFWEDELEDDSKVMRRLYN